MNKLIITLMVCLPLKHICLTSSFGYRIHPVTGKYAFHSGVDLRAKRDTVFALMDGLVRSAGYDRLLGIYVILDHSAFESGYGHLSQMLVGQGDSIRAGEAIGITGATGRVTGEHLHFSIRINKHYIDPLQFLNAILIQQNHE